MEPYRSKEVLKLLKLELIVHLQVKFPEDILESVEEGFTRLLFIISPHEIKLP